MTSELLQKTTTFSPPPSLSSSSHQLSTLTKTILSLPTLDAHAHSIFRNPTTSTSFINLEKIVTEADPPAQTDVRETVVGRRAVKELSRLYECEEGWESILKARTTFGKDVIKMVFGRSGIVGVLLDDGLFAPDGVLSVEEHKEFVTFPPKRILRIEVVVEEILFEVAQFRDTDCDTSTLWESFVKLLRKRLDEVPDNVVAFKSIIAYRSGLDVDTTVGMERVVEGFEEVVGELIRRPGYQTKGEKLESDGTSGEQRWRVTNKVLLDYIFCFALEIAGRKGLPVQLHVGIGDKDLDLLKANPLLLRNVLEDGRFSDTKIVLLHVWPYAKESAYLSSVYKQVYVDFGLADLIVSADGIDQTITELLTLTPTTKLHFSTDGHFHPESFYLAEKWGKEGLAGVLERMVGRGEIYEEEAVEIAKGVLFGNANELYRLGWDMPARVQSGDHLVVGANMKEVLDGVKVVRLIWVDYSNILRTKLIPIRHFLHSPKVSVTTAVLGLPFMHDSFAEGLSTPMVSIARDAVLCGDVERVRTVPWMEGHARVLGWFKDGNGEKHGCCPRAILQNVSRTLSETHNLTLHCGFELEFTLLTQSSFSNSESSTFSPEPIDKTSYCELSALHGIVAIVLNEMIAALEMQGIGVMCWHPESGWGQFEVVLEWAEVEEVVERVIFARTTIGEIAARHGLKATFAPKVFPDQAGNSTHVHISLNKDSLNIFMSSSPDHNLSNSFTAGILHHLPSLLSFTTPSVNSFERLKPGCWAGAYQAWGYQNKECPIRMLEDRVEIKCFDGTANPYLAMAAIIACGMDGIENGMLLPEPIQVDPQTLPEDIRPPRLPTRYSEALSNLSHDSVFEKVLGKEAVDVFVAIKKQEILWWEKNAESIGRQVLCQKY